MAHQFPVGLDTRHNLRRRIHIFFIHIELLYRAVLVKQGDTAGRKGGILATAKGHGKIAGCFFFFQRHGQQHHGLPARGSARSGAGGHLFGPCLVGFAQPAKNKYLCGRIAHRQGGKGIATRHRFRGVQYKRGSRQRG